MRLRLLLLAMFLVFVSIALATGWLRIALAFTTFLIALVLLGKGRIR